MKIFFSPAHYLVDELKGGEYGWSYSIIKQLTQRNEIEKMYILCGMCNSKHLRENEKCEITEVFKRGVLLSSLSRLWFALKSFFVAMRIAQKNDFDIIHHILPFGFNQTFNLFAIFYRKKPFVIGPAQVPQDLVDDIDSNKKIYIQSDANRTTVTENRALLFFENILLRCSKGVLAFLFSQTLKRADAIIAINKKIEGMLTSIVAKEKIFVIPTGIDLNLWSYKNSREKNSDVFNIATCGYFVYRKGIDIVIDAVKELREKKGLKNFCLYIVGDGPGREFLENKVKEHNLKENIVFTGFLKQQELNEFYKKIHLSVSMSRSESWGQMYLEALACGLPVVTSKNNGSNEIIVEGECGYLVEQEDAQSLAEKIVFLLQNSEVLNTMSEKARNLVEQKYDWETVIIPQYIQIYNSLLKERTV